MSGEMESLLMNVRNAQRVMVAYSQRISSLVQRVAAEFDASFYRWETGYDLPTREGVDPLAGKWSWDWALLADTSFLYLPTGHKTAQSGNSWLLDIRVTTDTAVCAEFDDQPDPLTMPAVENTETLVRVYAFRSRVRSRREWKDLWDSVEYPEQEGVLERLEEDVEAVCIRLNLADTTTEARLATELRRLRSVLEEMGFR